MVIIYSHWEIIIPIFYFRKLEPLLFSPLFISALVSQSNEVYRSISEIAFVQYVEFITIGGHKVSYNSWIQNEIGKIL